MDTDHIWILHLLLVPNFFPCIFFVQLSKILWVSAEKSVEWTAFISNPNNQAFSRDVPRENVNALRQPYGMNQLLTDASRMY